MPLVVVGRIVRPHGVHGDLIVEVRTDEPEQRFVAGAVLHTEPAEVGPLTLATVRWHQQRPLVTFAEVTDRADAERLRGVLLCVDRNELGVLDDPDEFRDHELVGLTVVDANDNEIGRIARIEHAPAHDLLVVDRPGDRPALIPFLKDMVPVVDVPGGRVRVTPPPGLLEL